MLLGPVTGERDLSTAEAKWVGADMDDLAGYQVLGADVDRDGFGDLFVGATGAQGWGAVYLAYGPVSGGGELPSADVVFYGDLSGGGAGWAFSVFDMDVDGELDVLVGAPFDDDTGGAVHVMRGAFPAKVSLAEAEIRITGESEDDFAGYRVYGADMDGSGVGDAVVSALLDDQGADDAGAVYVVLDPPDGETDLSGYDAKLVGEGQDDHAAFLAEPIDMDGDGYLDLLIGAVGEESQYLEGGAVYLVRGPVQDCISLSKADAKLLPERVGDYLGWPVRGQDMDADGWGDILAGSEKSDSGVYNGGAVYLVYGPVSGVLSSAEAGGGGGRPRPPASSTRKTARTTCGRCSAATWMETVLAICWSGPSTRALAAPMLALPTWC